MKREKKMDLFSIFSTLMIWGTLPILVTSEIWETHLPISSTDHILIQIALLLVVYGWAWFWISLQEYHRLRQIFRNDSQYTSLVCEESDMPVDLNVFEVTYSDEQKLPVETENRINQRDYVSNH